MGPDLDHLMHTASGSGYAVGFNLCPETLSPSLPLHRTCSNQVLHDTTKKLEHRSSGKVMERRMSC